MAAAGLTPSHTFVGAMEPMPSNDRLPLPPKFPSNRVSPTTIIPVEMPDCPDRAQARIQLIDGIEISQDTPVLKVQLDSPDACLHICRLNAVRGMKSLQFVVVFSIWTVLAFQEPANQVHLIDPRAVAIYLTQLSHQMATSIMFRTLTLSTQKSSASQVNLL
jgi:hypothetical protein